jgi:soluble lytic murein transglycosylase-like protein
VSLSDNLSGTFMNRRWAVAGGGFSNDWRVVCDCQTHRRQRSAFSRLRRLFRRRVALVTMAATMSFAAIGIPTKATMLEPAWSFMEKPAIVVDVVRTRQPFSTRYRAAYLDPQFLHQHRALISERVKEEFFRTEIPYGSIIYDEAKRNNLAPELVAAIVKTESDFRPALRSHKNAMGLMQIVPSTGRLVGARDLLDPADNIRAGTRYLRYLNRRFGGDQTMILAAYNAGEGNIARFGGVPPFRETQQYLQKVAKTRQRYTERIASRLAVHHASAMVIPGASATLSDLEGFAEEALIRRDESPN